MNVSPELDARFREAAASEGLLDVAYDLVDTPVGQLLVAVTDRGLCEVSFDPEPEREVETLARNFGARVPYGQLTTYGTLAAKAGRPRAARAVGTIMNRNPVPIVLPCHRVVGSTGALTGYGGGLDRKRTLLELEGALSPLT